MTIALAYACGLLTGVILAPIGLHLYASRVARLQMETERRKWEAFQEAIARGPLGAKGELSRRDVN